MNMNYLVIGILVAIVAVIAGVFLITAPHEQPGPVVYMVYGADKGDLSYTDSAYRGLFAAQEKMHFSKREFTSFNTTVFPELSRMKDGEKPGLVITIGFNYAGETDRLSEENPSIRFLAIDQTGIGSGNVEAYEITSYGESYLAGVLAAQASRTHRVGIILGMPSPHLDAFRQGYIDGARAADPPATVDLAYVSDTTAGFTDPGTARQIASRMYRNGTDVIYTVAGFSGTGAIAEAKTAPGRYIIGVDSDQTHLGPSVVLASAVKRMDLVVMDGIRKYLDGTFRGGNTVAGLKEGVTALVYNPKFSSYNASVSAWENKAREEEARYLAMRSVPAQA
ncbi:MAG: BMP family ABC transporter substrate-binding protein [Methanoregula sp.]